MTLDVDDLSGRRFSRVVGWFWLGALILVCLVVDVCCRIASRVR